VAFFKFSNISSLTGLAALILIAGWFFLGPEGEIKKTAVEMGPIAKSMVNATGSPSSIMPSGYPLQPRQQGLFAGWSGSGDRVAPGLVSFPQFGGQRRQRADYDPTYRNGVPNWKISKGFQYDEFRFVRVKYQSYGRTRWGQKWAIDAPDSDLNFSFRLQQLTSLKVNPDPIYLELTDDRIFDYPFMYMIEPGDIALSQEEANAMRHYLNNGGFIMVDDFWGQWEWQDFEDAMKMVFPNKSYVELELDHPVFHCVYDLKKKPQCPAIGNFERTGETSDRPWDPTAREVHYRGYYDDKDRLCMIACFNTDLGDGWEREGESEFYFKRFSEKEAYPMGINIVVYAMTH
jgi:hypothetical protein